MWIKTNAEKNESLIHTLCKQYHFSLDILHRVWDETIYLAIHFVTIDMKFIVRPRAVMLEMRKFDKDVS